MGHTKKVRTNDVVAFKLKDAFPRAKNLFRFFYKIRNKDRH